MTITVTPVVAEIHRIFHESEEAACFVDCADVAEWIATEGFEKEVGSIEALRLWRTMTDQERLDTSYIAISAYWDAEGPPLH